MNATSPKALVRRDLRRAVARNWLLVAAIFVMWTAATIGVVWLEVAMNGWGFRAGLLVGLSVSALVTLWHLFLSWMGFSARRMGVAAEASTSDALAKLGSGWELVDNVMLDAFDIDHVAIGPQRIYAVETKWSSTAGEFRTRKRLAGVAQHRASALQARLGDLGVERDVRPLLVLWGPGADVPMEVDELRARRTIVVAGRRSREWLPRLREAGGQGRPDAIAASAVRQVANDGQ